MQRPWATTETISPHVTEYRSQRTSSVRTNTSEDQHSYRSNGTLTLQRACVCLCVCVACGPRSTKAEKLLLLFSGRQVKVQPNSSVAVEQPMNINCTSWRNRAPLIRSGESNRDLRRRTGGFEGPAGTRLSSVNVTQLLLFSSFLTCVYLHNI